MTGEAKQIIEGQGYEYVSKLRELLDGVVVFLRRFLKLNDGHKAYDTIALWVAHTYVFEEAEATPYLHIWSAEKRSGKSRVLEVLELLAVRAWKTEKVTVPALYRKIQTEKPTLLLDETDAAFKGEKDYAEALRGVLNSGWRRGGSHTTCVGVGTAMTYQDFSTYSPKAIAGIGRHLPDTVADRSIRIEVKRKTKQEPVERFRMRRVNSESEPLREILAAWAAKTKCWEIDIPTVEKLNDRAEDIWEILFQIAEEAGGNWPERAMAAATSLSTDDQDDDSLGVTVLGDIRKVFEKDLEEGISSKDLTKSLTDMEESPWGEMRGGRQLTPVTLARLLKPFGIRPKNHRMGLNKTQVKGYLRSDFRDAWERYLPPTGNIVDKHSELHNEAASTVTVTDNRTDPVTVQLPVGENSSATLSSDAAKSVTGVTAESSTERINRDIDRDW